MELNAITQRTPARATLFLLATLGLYACASAPLPSNTTWKEEVRLHDGSTLIVERSQTTDPSGVREIGQGAPISEETLRFDTRDGREVTWRSDFGRGYQDNLTPLVLDIVDGTPYLLTYPTRCHAYNKWGRPNPPYVYFRYDWKQWQRIRQEELPPVMKNANLIIGGLHSLGGQLTDSERNSRHVSAEGVDRVNRGVGTDSQELRLIAQEPVSTVVLNCEEQVFYKGVWVAPGNSFGKRFVDRVTK